MENDLVKEVKQASKDLERRIYEAFVKINEKGISPEELTFFKDALGEAQMINLGVNNDNAALMERELFNLTQDVNEKINYFNSIIGNINEKDLKLDYANTQKDLYDKYMDLKNKGYTASELSNLGKIFNDLTAEYKGITYENLKEKSATLKSIKTSIDKEMKKLNSSLEDTIEFTINPEDLEDEKTEEIAVTKVHSPKDKSLYKYLIGGLAGMALLTALHMSGCNPLKSSAAMFSRNSEEKTSNNDEVVDSEVEVKDNVAELTVTPEPSNLKLGEVGTFLDATDNEQVEARAQYIIDNYYSKFMDKISADEKSQITLDRIANTIRVMNAQLPLDDNGYKYYDPNVVDTYGQAFLDLVCNIPSSDVMGTVEMVPAYLFAIDGSKLQDYIKTYDELYAKVAEGRNKRDDSIYRPAAEEIARLYWFGWFLQGQNNYVNPCSFNAEDRYFAYMATTQRYGSFIKEAEFNQMAAVCIDSCIDYSSKTPEPLSIAEIYTAINEGVWNNIIAKSAGIEVPTEPMLVGYWEALDAQLSYIYEHSEAKTLK